jgi:2-polyprenyl-3-methyl-5-hydroxy-6-metoxy-1,4-benzoquinol methylase
MKNILNDKPANNLSGRLMASVNFVEDIDLEDKTVLDIGCGYGWCEINFLERGVRKIVAIEVSEMDLATIQKNINNSKLELRVSSATSLPFEANSFDTIVSWEVIEHIPRGGEKAMFSEVERVLKPGGVFYLSTPHRSLFSNILDPAWWLIGHRHYSLGDFEKFTNIAQLNIDVVKIKGGWWSLLSLLNMYISKWMFRRKPILENFLSKKENIEYIKDNGFTNLFIKFRKPL